MNGSDVVVEVLPLGREAMRVVNQRAQALAHEAFTLLREQLSIKARAGGERFRLAPNRPSISLKHAYQMCGVAPMLRAQLPLLYRGERLVHVVGVGDVF